MSSPARADQRALADLASATAVDTERRVGWLRLPAIALVAATRALPHDKMSSTAFVVAVALALIYGAGALVRVYFRPVTPRFALVTTAADVVVITALTGLAGGAYSEARWGYALIPIIVAFRFQPVLCAGAGAASVVAFLAQALAESSGKAHAARLVALHAGYLIWLTAAATLLSFLLRHRTERVGELLVARQRLMTEALTAEDRERRTLAEGLHDETIQNLLSARQDLAEASASSSHPALDRADAAIRTTLAELREAIFRLHPSIREEVGLGEALRALGEQAARRGGFRLHVDVRDGGPHPHERLLIAAAREFLANAAEHASAENVSLQLYEEGHELVLAVTDDGRGFDARAARERLAAGHIGLASQRARIETVGGRLGLRSQPGRGTTVEIRLPA